MGFPRKCNGYIARGATLHNLEFLGNRYCIRNLPTISDEINVVSKEWDIPRKFYFVILLRVTPDKILRFLPLK